MHTARLTLLVATVLALSLAACGGGNATVVPLQGAAGGSQEGEQPPAQDSAPLPPIDLAGPQVGTTMLWVDGGTLVFVPAGEFIMGAGGDDNPEHVVALSEYWIYRTKVSNRMYAACVGLGVCQPPQDPEAAAALGDRFLRDRPVTGVTWEQAQAYCAWTQGHLPTEAQWEKAARGPQGDLYPWGAAAPACDLLNFEGCLGKTSRVFDYPAGSSHYQALDLSGNVFEWASDWYDPLYYPNAPAQDPTGPASGTLRSVRGSSFESPADRVAPSLRHSFEPAGTRPDLGFRCVIQSPGQYAPFCVTGAYAEREPGSPPPSRGCELTASRAGFDCGFATADLSGGTITSVNAETFDCSLAGGSRVFCSGESGATDSVTICGLCEGGSIGETGTPPDPECNPGYETSTTAPNGCDYQGGDPGGCPPGTYFDTGLERCVGDGGPGEYNGGECPPGTYFDTLAETCVGGEPGGECPPGYEYDPELLCCAVPGGGPFETPGLTGYPGGCDADEYYDTLEGACLPVPLEGGASGEACVELSLTIGECSGPNASGSDAACSGPCSSHGDPASCSACGCTWDTGFNRCT